MCENVTTDADGERDALCPLTFSKDHLSPFNLLGPRKVQLGSTFATRRRQTGV